MRSNRSFGSGLSTLVASATRGINFMNAVDTNVFIYALDDDEPVKQAKAHELLQQLAV